MALYGPALKKLIPPGKTDPRITPRVVILHVAVNESPSLYDYFNGPSRGVESHFYVRRDGTVEQYRDTAWQADANMQANDFAISIETQGMAAGEWTPEQLAAIKALLTWCHTTHGIPLTVPTRWDGSGVGYHILFMQEWAGGPRSCPGPDRVKQFQNVLVPWMAAGPRPIAAQEDDMPAPKDLWDYKITGPDGKFEATAGAWLAYANDKAGQAARDAGAALAVVKALAGKPQGLTAEEIEAAARAGAQAALDERIDNATVTLNTIKETP